MSTYEEGGGDGPESMVGVLGTLMGGSWGREEGEVCLSLRMEGCIEVEMICWQLETYDALAGGAEGSHEG